MNSLVPPNPQTGSPGGSWTLTVSGNTAPNTCPDLSNTATAYYDSSVEPEDAGTSPNVSGTGNITVQSDSCRPLFVIGNVESHAVGDTVNFWGSQWWKNNFMSGFVGNGVAAFKGYADEADDFCGPDATWLARPGNSSTPPDTIPDDVLVIVTDTVHKDGPNISGNIVQILLVHSDGNYGPAPGHRGGGQVTQILCPR